MGDLEILRREYDVTIYHYDTRRNALYVVFRQFFWLMFNVWRFSKVYIWFGDYHAFFPVLFSRLFRKRSFLVVGGYDVCRIKKLKYGSFSNPLRGWITRYAMRHCTLNLCVSKHVERKLRIITRKQNSVLLYNGTAIQYEDVSAENKKDVILTVALVKKQNTFAIKGIDRFYALANLEGLKNAETVIEKINSLEKDKTFDLTSLNAQLKDMPAYHAGEGGTYIPMSSYGYEQYVDENTSKLKDDIELIRLIGKVTLEVRNKTGKDLTLKKLQMGQFTGKLNIEGDIPKFPTTSTDEDFTSTTFYSDETGMSIPQYDDSKEETGAKYFMYYVNETYNAKASDPELQITAVTYPPRDENEKPSGFSFVRRNDWLQIPVQITNVTTRIEFDQKHMPIGGLPESLEFGKISVPIAYCRTTHGGDITVNFALTEVSGMGSNPQLSFYSGSYEG